MINIHDVQIKVTVANLHRKAYVCRKASNVDANDILPRVVALILKNCGKRVYANVLSRTDELINIFITGGNLRTLILTVIDHDTGLGYGNQLFRDRKYAVVYNDLIIAAEGFKNCRQSVRSCVLAGILDQGQQLRQNRSLRVDILVSFLTRKRLVCLKLSLRHGNLNIDTIYQLIIYSGRAVFNCYRVDLSLSAKEITDDILGSSGSVGKRDRHVALSLVYSRLCATVFRALIVYFYVDLKPLDLYSKRKSPLINLDHSCNFIAVFIGFNNGFNESAVWIRDLQDSQELISSGIDTFHRMFHSSKDNILQET